MGKSGVPCGPLHMQCKTWGQNHHVVTCQVNMDLADRSDMGIDVHPASFRLFLNVEEEFKSCTMLL